MAGEQLSESWCIEQQVVKCVRHAGTGRRVGVGRRTGMTGGGGGGGMTGTSRCRGMINVHG